jgi:transposase
VEIIEENNDATLKELTELLESKTGIKVSISTMGRISNQLNYIFKKKSLYAAEKRSERVQKARVEFWEKIREVRAQDLIFIDESEVNLAMVRL